MNIQTYCIHSTSIFISLILIMKDRRKEEKKKEKKEDVLLMANLILSLY